jgi:hypothetical protein
MRSLHKTERERNIKYTILPLFVLLILSLQCIPLVSRYDPITYKNLTDLKPVILFLYDSFGSDSLNVDNVAEARLKLAQVFEYERGKGLKNKDTYDQIKKIQEMFERHVKDRLDNGKWIKEHINNVKVNIEEAFDLAIQTEALKNK